MNPYYKDYSEYLRERFGEVKVQKLSVDAGFSCPNRDGTISRGGCIYCDNRSFTPSYCDPADGVARQLAEGKRFFARKYPQMKYLAYFQSFTGTHARALPALRALYEEAASQPDIVGLIIGTRPDALPDGVVNMLAELNRRLPVIVEIGAETSHDRTLSLVNRCHTWSDVEEAVKRLDNVGIESGLHLIAGLPGEDDDDVLTTVERALQLPVATLKLHQLQVVAGTPLYRMMERGEIAVNPYDLDSYLDLCVRVVERVRELRPDVALERFVAQAPPEMVVAPKWGIKNYQFVNLLHRRLSKS